MTTSNDPITVFISHAHADLPFARRLTRALQSHGIRVWLDEDEVHWGDSLIETIERGLLESGAVLVVVSRSSIESKWSQYEWQAVVAHDPADERRKLIIPVVLDDSQIPMPLADIKYADFSRDFEQPLNELIESLQHRFPNATKHVPQRRPLPVMPAHFVGRDNELHQIEKAFRDYVAVLLVGFGGIGKTALALHWANWARKTEFASDFVWISCQSQTPTAFVTDLEQQLGLSSTSDSTESRIRTIAEYLHTAPITLIFDDVADELIPLLRPLLTVLSQSQPRSRILLTSRSALQKLVDFDVAILQLSPLSVDQSITFLQNALARSSKALATEDLARIASWSQGIPLALQLVSGLLRQGRSVEEILSAPEKQFEELGVGVSLSRSFEFAYV